MFEHRYVEALGYGHNHAICMAVMYGLLTAVAFVIGYLLLAAAFEDERPDRR